MDDIVKLVAQKTGLPEAKAKQAVETVIEVLKERLPDPIAGQLEAVLSGEKADLGSLTKGLGSLFGKK